MTGQPARWYPFDFEAGLRADGTYGIKQEAVEAPPAPIILLDGAYTANSQLNDVIDFTILVDVPTNKRHSRLEMREDQEFLKGWHQLWDPVEAYYFKEVRPKSSFDLVVITSRNKMV